MDITNGYGSLFINSRKLATITIPSHADNLLTIAIDIEFIFDSFSGDINDI